MKMNRYPLTHSQFDKLLQFDDWNVKEVPFEVAKSFPNLPRRDDVIAVFASGDMNGTKLLNGVNAVLGMDVIAHETDPDLGVNEPELNIYHCVIQKLAQSKGEIAYIMYAPSRDETLFGHWKDYSVLDDYLNAVKGSDHICEERIDQWCDETLSKTAPEAFSDGPP